MRGDGGIRALMARQPAIPCDFGFISRFNDRGVIKWRLRATIDGVEKSLGLYDTIEAAQKESAALAKAHGVAPTELTILSWAKIACETRERIGKRDVRETLGAINRYVKGDKLGSVGLRQIRPEQVREWIYRVAQRKIERGKRKGRPISGNTVRNALRAVSAVLTDAVEAGKLTRNPALGIRPPKVPRDTEEWTYLTASEIAYVLAHPAVADDARLLAIVTVAIYTGLREGELWGLRWEDVRFGDEPEIVVCRSYGDPPKSGKPRRVPLLPAAERALRRWKDEQQCRARAKAEKLVRRGRPIPLPSEASRTLVFPTTRGTMATDGYDAGWSKLADEMGLRDTIVFHSLRHTFGSHLVMGTWGRPWRLEEVQRLMGHEDIKTTQRYADMAPEAIAGAAREARIRWVSGNTSGNTKPDEKKT